MTTKLVPVGKKIFVQRDPIVDELFGMKVGDRAKTKALTGVVVKAGKNCLVQEGDVLHLPHQAAMVEECKVDGRELSCIKAGDLFAVKKDGAFRPINRFVKVRKCTNDHVRDESGKIALYMTDNFIEFTEWVEILEVAEDCQWIGKEYVGWFCLAPENNDKLQRLERSHDYCLHESLIKFITDGE